MIYKCILKLCTLKIFHTKQLLWLDALCSDRCQDHVEKPDTVPRKYVLIRQCDSAISHKVLTLFNTGKWSKSKFEFAPLGFLLGT